MKAVKNDLETLVNEREQLFRELRGTQEMLAFVLESVGEPIRVAKEKVQKGLPDHLQIVVDDDLSTNEFVFYLEKLDD